MRSYRWFTPPNSGLPMMTPRSITSPSTGHCLPSPKMRARLMVATEVRLCRFAEVVRRIVQPDAAIGCEGNSRSQPRTHGGGLGRLGLKPQRYEVRDYQTQASPVF